MFRTFVVFRRHRRSVFGFSTFLMIGTSKLFRWGPCSLYFASVAIYIPMYAYPFFVFLSSVSESSKTDVCVIDMITEVQVFHFLVDCSPRPVSRLSSLEWTLAFAAWFDVLVCGPMVTFQRQLSCSRAQPRLFWIQSRRNLGPYDFLIPSLQP